MQIANLAFLLNLGLRLTSNNFEEAGLLRFLNATEPQTPETVKSNMKLKGLDDTDLVLVFAIFRHGDRTPDQEELDLLPSLKANWTEILFPYGLKALTNKGKRRGYSIGKYLRKRYNGFISKLYLPDEIEVRTTSYARTKMTALTLLAALYKPIRRQKWNRLLSWQPVPYITVPRLEDDLIYWNTCPKYLSLRDQEYEKPEFKSKIKEYGEFFAELSTRTKTNISTPEQVWFLDNLFQALINVEYPPPRWTRKLMPQIKEMTKIEYDVETCNDQLIRLSTGVLMNEIVNASNAAVKGEVMTPKMRLYAAHENNVAALMAGVGVFEPHQPNYGATFFLELRRNRRTGQYGMTALYSRKAGKRGIILPIYGCDKTYICDYDIFLNLTQNILLTKEQYLQECGS